MDHPILEALRRDHESMTRVMQVASHELDELADGREADYGLLEDALRYMTGYADIQHHPVEDLIYAELRKLAPGPAGDVEPVIGQHAELIRHGQAFLETVAAVEESAIVRRDRFVEAGRAYLSVLGEHIRVEEAAFFPRAAEILPPESWALIEAGFQRSPDPLFGPSVEREFANLLRRIDS